MMMRRPVRSLLALAALLAAVPGCFGVPVFPAVPDVCGDGLWGATEECDPSFADHGVYCTDRCSWGACGDGVVQPGEQCDPGVDPACDVLCIPAGCGNGIVGTREFCHGTLPTVVVDVGAPIRAVHWLEFSAHPRRELFIATAAGIEWWRWTTEGTLARHETLALSNVVTLAEARYDDATLLYAALDQPDGVELRRYRIEGDRLAEEYRTKPLEGFQPPLVARPIRFVQVGPEPVLITDSGLIELDRVALGPPIWELRYSNAGREGVTRKSEFEPVALGGRPRNPTPERPLEVLQDLWTVRVADDGKKSVVRLSYVNLMNPSYIANTFPVETADGTPLPDVVDFVELWKEPSDRLDPRIVAVLADGRGMLIEKVEQGGDVVFVPRPGLLTLPPGHAWAAGPLDGETEYRNPDPTRPRGIDDLVTANDDGLHVRFSLRSDEGAKNLPLDAPADDVDVLDADGDGHADLVTVRSADGRVTVHRGNP